jgi:hypothetical protein
VLSATRARKVLNSSNPLFIPLAIKTLKKMKEILEYPFHLECGLYFGCIMLGCLQAIQETCNTSTGCISVLSDIEPTMKCIWVFPFWDTHTAHSSASSQERKCVPASQSDKRCFRSAISSFQPRWGKKNSS